MIRAIIVFSLLLFQCFHINSQKIWEQIASYPNFDVEDIALDSSGNLYFSVAGHTDVYHTNIFGRENKISKLPRIQHWWQYGNYIFESDKICFFLDKNQELVAMVENGRKYRLINGQFLEDNLHYNGRVPQEYYGCDIKYDLLGNYFYNDFLELFKYEVLYDYNGSVQVQKEAGGIYDYEVLDEENNYLLTTSNAGGSSVLKFNSRTGLSENIIITPTGYSSIHMVVTLDKQILLSTKKGLLHYMNDGKDFTIPLIDPIAGPYVSVKSLDWTKSKDALVVQLESGLYLSYDTAKSWIRPWKLNQNIEILGNGNIAKMIVVDSSTAVATYTKRCGTIFGLIVLKSDETEWRKLDAGVNYVSIDVRHKAKDNRLFAYSSTDCQYMYSNGLDQKWNFMYLNGYKEPIKEITFSKNEYILTRKDISAAIYHSEDGGQNWSLVFEPVTNIKNPVFILPFSNGSTGIIFLNDERFFQSDIFGKNFQEKSVVHYPQGVRVDQLILDNTDKLFMVGNNKVYSSLDYGMTWELDTRFSQINVKKIFLFDDANRPVVFGTYLSQDGTYLITDLNNYRLLSKGPNPVWYLGEERIGIIEETKGILYSEDYGETWNDITVDQPFDRSYRIPHFTSMFLDRDGYFYTSRKYEGVYKTVKPLVSTQDEILEEVAISPNPVRVYLSINLGEENSGNIQVQIMNLLGQTVWSGNMNGNQTRIQLTSLPLGMYSLKLIKEGQLVHSEKIVKQ